MAAVQPLLHPHYVRSEELGREITELCAYIYAATYQLLVKIHEFDRDGLWKLNGVCSCAHWLNWQCGIGMNAAREKVRVANALASLPLISEAFAKGEVSYSKVRAMTRVATPENESYLMSIAHYGTAHQVESLVRQYRRSRRLNGIDNASDQHRDRELSYYYDDDGSLAIRGRFPTEQGAMILKALEMAMDRAEAEDTDQEADEPSEQAELGEDERQQAMIEKLNAQEPLTMQRADALAELSETYLANGPASSSSADRYQVMLHVSAETLTASECTPDNVTAETQGSIRRIHERLEELHIDAETCSSNWYGEKMDHDIAVGIIWNIDLPDWEPERSY